MFLRRMEAPGTSPALFLRGSPHVRWLRINGKPKQEAFPGVSLSSLTGQEGEGLVKTFGNSWEITPDGHGAFRVLSMDFRRHAPPGCCVRVWFEALFDGEGEPIGDVYYVHKDGAFSTIEWRRARAKVLLGNVANKCTFPASSFGY